jgi:hypothetical protein
MSAGRIKPGGVALGKHDGVDNIARNAWIHWYGTVSLLFSYHHWSSVCGNPRVELTAERQREQFELSMHLHQQQHRRARVVQAVVMVVVVIG